MVLKLVDRNDKKKKKTKKPLFKEGSQKANELVALVLHPIELEQTRSQFLMREETRVPGGNPQSG